MSAGTITLTNGSAVVGGTGTSFTTELAAGDFIVSTVGGVPYTLPVKTVDGNTQLTLVSNFTGPTQAGAAWSAVPRVALNMVTAVLVAQSAEALRGLNYDKQNWQQVYSAAGNITVNLPDGTTFTGPSWKYLADNMATKTAGAVPVNQGGTGATTAADARTNLGLGSSATRDVGAVAGTVAAGDDTRLNTVQGKTGGVITGSVTVSQASAIGVTSTNGGDKAIYLSNRDSDGPADNYVNWLAGAYYSGSWRLGAIRGSGVNIDRVQMNIFDGVSLNADFRWTPNGIYQANCHLAPGLGGGGGYNDINDQNNVNNAFSRTNLVTPNDAGYVPALRWSTYSSGGYHATTAIGSISGGTANWPEIQMVTHGDDGAAGTRIFAFTVAAGDITVSANGSFVGNYIFSKQPTSDATLKKEITYNDGRQSYSNIKALKPSTFIYKNDDEGRVRRGVIAQDVMQIDPEYVKEVPGCPYENEEGEIVRGAGTLALDSNVLLLDTTLALNYVIKKLEATQNELDELKLKIAGS